MNLKFKIIIFLFLIILLSFSVSGLDCQYTKEIIEFESVENYYLRDILIGTNINLLEAINYSISSNIITVYNYLPINTGVNLTYTRYNSLWKSSTRVSYNIIIGAKNSYPHMDNWVGEDKRYRSLRDISVKLSNEMKIKVLSEIVNKTIIDCEQCAGKDCLNDGQKCNSDINCGSGICNIAGVCGKTKIVPCPVSLKNCNNKTCSRPASLNTGESYQCDWQCNEGTIACEGICRNVSSKKKGEEYHCVEECKSQKGEEGICKISNSGLILKIILFITLIIFIAYIAIFIGFRPLIRKHKKAERELKDIEDKIEKNREEIDNIERTIQEKEKKKERLEEKIKNAEGVVKERLEEELKEQEKELEGRKESLEKTKRDLNKQEKDFKKKSREHYIQVYTDRYGDKIYLDDKGYFRFKDGDELLHRSIYESYEGKIKKGYIIHHIDANHYNNEIYNLIEIPFSIHKFKVKHGRIPFSDWEAGIVELERLGLEKYFHDEIEKKL